MTERETTPESELDDARRRAELIERIYEVAIRPHAYDDFLEKWEEHVRRALQELRELERETDIAGDPRLGDLSRHFDMGFRLLEEIGRSDPARGPGGGAERMPNAASLLVDRSGRVVWYNAAAGRHFGLHRGSHVEMIELWERSRDGIGAMLAALADGAAASDAGRVVLRARSRVTGGSLFLMARPVEDGAGEPVIMISQITAGWPEAVGRMLSASFGLTEAELQVAEALAAGAGTEEIARHRASSVNTVRTQLKAIMAKTGVGSRADLVRLLVTLASAVEEPDSRPRHVLVGRSFRFRQRDGRVVPCHRFGAEKGRPFVMFHGMLSGCDLSAAVDDLLRRHDITLLVPERPFFGDAAGDSGPIRNAPERVARDAEDLLDHLGVGAVGVIGHMVGSIHAFTAAALMGDRVRAIVSVAGGVPIVSSWQFATMSARQRLIAHTARYAPKLLPFVLRAGIRQLDSGGEERFLHALYENSPPDLEALTDAETARIIASGLHFSVAQGHRAFEIDAWHAVRDWSWRVALSDAPVTLIHGRHDPVVAVASVEDFARRLGGRARLEVIGDGGQLLFYHRPERVVGILAEVAAQGGWAAVER